MVKTTMGRGEKEAILALCKEALAGTLTMDEFVRRWPKGAEAHPLIKRIESDIGEAIVHVPVRLCRGGIADSWVSEPEYKAVLLDYLLLGFDKPDEELLELRQAWIEDQLSEEEIRGRLSDRWGSRGQPIRK